jgi:phage gpG-like protein
MQMDNNRSYIRLFEDVENALQTIPNRVATLAVNFTKERFREKNWFDETAEAWPKTSKRKGSTLIASGRLRNSIRKISIMPDSITIGTDVPYAQIQNEGGEISGTETVKQHRVKSHYRRSHMRKGKRIKRQLVKAHTVRAYSRRYNRKYPKRQFIGQSQELLRRVDKLIQDEIDNVLRG